MARDGQRRLAWLGVLAVSILALGYLAAELSAPAETVAVEAAAIPRTPMRISYGNSPETFGDLYLPPTSNTRLPVVVLIHGGGWAHNRTLAQFDAHARALADDGVAVWNIEYRRVNAGGGWPTTLTDVDAAVNALATVVAPRLGNLLDLQRVHLAGHSAGGHLVAWTAGHRSTEPPRHPAIRIRSLTLMAAVLDMELAVTESRDSFVPKLLGGTPAEVPDRYRDASPIHHLPPKDVRITALHGANDRVVAPSQSHRYGEAVTRADGTAEVRILLGIGHGEFADAGSTAWSAAHDAIIGHVTAIG
ncbi:alpha/beta hydrolase [Nocardia alba]|uniref:Alpha/beta hydrolase family protein n=1 Tax=Nocardia alba TaxID=225051 RepID=A0A4R1FRK8_9NOCA|nr:alpha/beta fold hydrolase [Nocardia alba]TCJ94968.1 alpha/beta hydrolase family protein [Nocardia alba]